MYFKSYEKKTKISKGVLKQDEKLA